MNLRSQRRKAGLPMSGRYGYIRRRNTMPELVGLPPTSTEVRLICTRLTRRMAYMNALAASANSSGASAMSGSNE